MKWNDQIVTIFLLRCVSRIFLVCAVLYAVDEALKDSWRASLAMLFFAVASGVLDVLLVLRDRGEL